MKRLVAVLLVLVGTTAMSFACVTRCSKCGNEWDSACMKMPTGAHTNNKTVRFCDECPTCTRCWQKGHNINECTVSNKNSNAYDRGYHNGISGKENNCNPNSSYLNDCDRGYRNGVSDLNAAKRGEFSSEE